MDDFEGAARELWGSFGSISAETGVASHGDVYRENGMAYRIAAHILAIHLHTRDINASDSKEEA